MMLSARRSAGRVAARQTRARQPQQRRFESHESHGHGEHAAVPANESISWKFWVGLGIFPVSYFVYNASRPSEEGHLSGFSSFIEKYSTSRAEWERRNTLHTAAIEQAAHDRHLFQGSEKSKRIELGYPEVFNTGSPINVPAGHYTNIETVIEHYKKANAEQEEKTLRRLEEGKQIE